MEHAVRQSYLQLYLRLIGVIGRLKKKQTLLISSISFSNKNPSLAQTHYFFIPLLQDWTSGSLVHKLQKGWRETLKWIMKFTAKRKYSKSNCIAQALAFSLSEQALDIVTILLYMYYFYIVQFLWLQCWKLKTPGFPQGQIGDYRETENLLFLQNPTEFLHNLQYKFLPFFCMFVPCFIWYHYLF